MHLRRRPGPIGARGDANEKRADFSGRVARRRGGVAAGTTPPAGATVVPQAARRSDRHFGPHGLVDACFGGGAVRTGRGGSGDDRPRGLACRRGVRDLSRHRRATDGRWCTHVGWRRGLRVHAGREGLAGERRAACTRHPSWRLLRRRRGRHGYHVVVGADNHDNMGAAYVFAKESSGWHLSAELAGSMAGPAAVSATRWPSGRAPSWSACQRRCWVLARLMCSEGPLRLAQGGGTAPRARPGGRLFRVLCSCVWLGGGCRRPG